jgi:phosphoribosylaminoimidazole (AIR) synthetase
VARVLGPRVDAAFDRDRWETPRIFTEVQRAGDISDDEMARVFNLGLGMVVAVAPSAVDKTLGALQICGQQAVVAGYLTDGEGRVRLG